MIHLKGIHVLFKGGHLHALHNVCLSGWKVVKRKAGIRAGSENKLSEVCSPRSEIREESKPGRPGGEVRCRCEERHSLLPSIITSHLQPLTVSPSLCLLCSPGRCFAFRGERGNDEPPIEMIKVSHLKWVVCPPHQQHHTIFNAFTWNTHFFYIYICTVYTNTQPLPAYSHISLSPKVSFFNFAFIFSWGVLKLRI